MGGIIVIAGDSMEINYVNPNGKENIRERLITRFGDVLGPTFG